MRNTKILKLVDLLVQVMAICVPWLVYLAFPGNNRFLHLEHLVTSYFVVGVALVASCLANWRYLAVVFRARSRHWFEIILLLLLAMAVIATLMKALLLLLMILFYIVPVITAWYIGISVAELWKLNKRPASDSSDVL